MGQIVTVTRPIATTGSAGSAAGSDVTDVLMGYLLDLDLDWSSSAPGTTDITIKQTGDSVNLLAINNSAADVHAAVRDAPVSRANAAITNAFDRIPLNGTITTTITGCDQLATALTLKIRYEKL